jgi:hypothetical protein
MTRPTGQPRAQNALEVAAQIEDCELSVLPPQLTMHPVRPAGQPEALLGTAGGYVLVEARASARLASSGSNWPGVTSQLSAKPGPETLCC